MQRTHLTSDFCVSGGREGHDGRSPVSQATTGLLAHTNILCLGTLLLPGESPPGPNL